MSCLNVVTLWMTGDRQFMSRMVRCCRIVVSSKKISRSTIKRWPRMFSELPRLETLRISVAMTFERIDIVSAQIKKLPSSLVELWLCFYLASTISMDDFGFEKKVGYISAHPPNTTNFTPRWPLKDHFPHLRVLAMVEGKVLRSTSTSYTLDARCLPPGLEELHWTSYLTEYSIPPDSLLNLKILDLDQDCSGRISEKVAAALPPGLTQLYGACVTTIEQLQMLPRTLRGSNFLASTVTKIDSDVLAAMPPHIESLGTYCSVSHSLLQTYGDSWTMLLPTSLTKFDCNLLKLNPVLLSHLPHSITQLEDIHWQVEEFTSIVESECLEAVHKLWPPNLVSVSFAIASTTSSINMASLIVLPPSITAIQRLFPDPDAQLLDHLSGLPSRLTSLDCLWKNASPVSIINTLPQSLTSIRLSSTKMSPQCLPILFCHFYTIELPDTSIGESDLKSSISLEGLKVRKLRLFKIHGSALTDLPATLTKLTVFSIMGAVEGNVRSLLPPNLEKFTVLKM